MVELRAGIRIGEHRRAAWERDRPRVGRGAWFADLTGDVDVSTRGEPLRELGRVRPPVRDILMRGSPGLRRLLFLHHALPARKLSTKHRSEQYRSEQIYCVINSDLW